MGLIKRVRRRELEFIDAVIAAEVDLERGADDAMSYLERIALAERALDKHHAQVSSCWRWYSRAPVVERSLNRRHSLLAE